MVGKNSALTTSAYRAQQWLFMLASKSEPRNEDLHADAPRLYRLRSACRFPPGCTGPTGSALVLQIWLPASMDHRERVKCGGGERVGLFDEMLSRPQGQSRCLRARPDPRAEEGHHDGTSSKLSATRAFLCTLPRQVAAKMSHGRTPHFWKGCLAQTYERGQAARETRRSPRRRTANAPSVRRRAWPGSDLPLLNCRVGLHPVLVLCHEA